MLRFDHQKTDVIQPITVNIPIERIEQRKYPLRKTHYEIESLAKSISLFGLLQPLVVRNISTGFEIVCGERRYLAARLAGLTAVPCTVVEMSDSMAVAAALIENIQRQELFFLDRVEIFKYVIEKFHFSWHKLAVLLSISIGRVSSMFHFDELDESQKEHLRNAQLSESHANILLDAPSELRDRLLRYTIKNELTPIHMYTKLESMLLKEKVERSYQKRSKPLSDLKLFFNSVEKAVRIIRLAGVNVVTERSEFHDHIEYKISIKR